MYTQASQLWSWFKRICGWLARPKSLWIATGIVAFACIVALRPGTSEPTIRWTGLVLQLLGIGTVIVGIEKTRHLFHQHTLLGMAAEWLKQFPAYRRSVVIGVGAGALASATAKARAYVTSNPPADATVEQRVASLENNVGHLNNRIDDVYKELDTAMRDQTAALDQERRDRASEDSKIASKLEVSGTGGLHISAIGALWLFVGVVLGTGSVEIEKWLK